MTTSATGATVPTRPGTRRPGPLGLIRTGLSELFGRRRLTRYLVGADIKRTHSDTVLGQLWWVIDPLLQMAVYIVLVSIIFQKADAGLPAVHLRGDPAVEVVHDHAERRDPVGHRAPGPHPADPVPQDRPAVVGRHRRDLELPVRPGRARHRLPVLPRRPAHAVGAAHPGHRRGPVPVHDGARASCCRR